MWLFLAFEVNLNVFINYRRCCLPTTAHNTLHTIPTTLFFLHSHTKLKFSSLPLLTLKPSILPSLLPLSFFLPSSLPPFLLSPLPPPPPHTWWHKERTYSPVIVRLSLTRKLPSTEPCDSKIFSASTRDTRPWYHDSFERSVMTTLALLKRERENETTLVPSLNPSVCYLQWRVPYKECTTPPRHLTAIQILYYWTCDKLHMCSLNCWMWVGEHQAWWLQHTTVNIQIMTTLGFP